MSDRLTLTANFEKPDAFFAAMTAAHDGLTKEESDAFNARLLFLLANHIGEHAVLKEALATATRHTR